MDTINIAQKILRCIEELRKGRKLLQERAEAKAIAISEYDRAITVTILKLKSGQMMELDGEKVENPQTTIIEKIAKGICWKERLEMEKAEAMYRNAVSGMNSLQAELNGMQSLNRHLSEV